MSELKETPQSQNAAGSQDSSGGADGIKRLLEKELDLRIELDHQGFVATFYPENPAITPHVHAVWKKCYTGPNALFDKTWRGWKNDNESEVQKSFERVLKGIVDIVDELGIPRQKDRRFVARPNDELEGRPKLKPDMILVVSDGSQSTPAWKDVLSTTEIKPPRQDKHKRTKLAIAQYSRAVFMNQDSRRFVLGKTLSGTLLRLWEFDRLGATTSSLVDIGKDGEFLVKVVLHLLLMDDERLGFDPDLHKSAGERVVTIIKDGAKEHLRLKDRIRSSADCIVGRATTCWTAHREGDESEEFVVKDSWQYVDRPEEGSLLRDADKAGVKNIAKYYHHEDVYFNGKRDCVISNIRNNMRDHKETVYPLADEEGSLASSAWLDADADPGAQGSHGKKSKQQKKLGKKVVQSKGRATKKKRPSAEDATNSQPAKRVRSSLVPVGNKERPEFDRVRRRIVLKSVGKPLLEASNLAALVTGLLGGVKGELRLLQVKQGGRTAVH